MSRSKYDTIKEIASTIRHIFDDYHIVNKCTSDGRVVIDVSDHIADWIWGQEIGMWETSSARSISSMHRRYIITQELLTLLMLRWPK